MAKTISTKKPAKRFGIAEWFGHDIAALSPEQIDEMASAALGPAGVMPCPFMASIDPSAKCNKAGGVCSMRPVSQGPFLERQSLSVKKNDAKQEIDVHAGLHETDGPVVTICPQRFVQNLTAFRAIGKTVLGTDSPILISETPFLGQAGGSEEDSTRKAGRIDWILVRPDSLNAGQLRWCAIETQALYFSGRLMKPDFEAYAAQRQVIFPSFVRRPDHRSSAAKRLAPQLSVKVPRLTQWSAKTVVLVDQYFRSKMGVMPDALLGQHSESDKLDAAELVFAVMKYQNGVLQPPTFHYPTLVAAIDALDAAKPIPRSIFENNLRIAAASGLQLQATAGV